MYLYFAGAEAHCPRLYENGVRNMLASFYYIRRKRKQAGYKYMEQMFQRYGKTIRWFMDSGAFTMQQEGRDKDADKFLDDYIYMLKQWRNYLHCCVELDLDVYMGMGWTQYARARILNETSFIPILVHHPDTRTFPEFINNCKRYPWIGFSIGDGDLFEGNAFMKYYLEACRTKTKLHAFGITQPRILSKYHFYSCDSFSWSMGAKFGTTFINKARGNLHRYNNFEKSIRRSLLSRLRMWGIPVIDVLNDKYIAVDRWNIIAWMICEEDLNKQFGEPYWKEPRHSSNQIPKKIGLKSVIYDADGNIVNPVQSKVISKNRQIEIRSRFKSRGDKSRQWYVKSVKN